MIGGRFVACALAAVALAVSGLAARAQEGRWGPLVSLPIVPSSAAVLKNGKVLFWAADGEFSFTSVGRVYAALYDPATGAIDRRFAQLGHNMFCTGTTLLADGRVFVNGGSNAERVSIYDPVADTFTRGDDMWLPRGYNANTILQDGSVLTMGGSWAGPGETRKDGEIWTPGSGWRKPAGLSVQNMQSSTLTDFGKDSHFALIPTGNGRVLYAAPGPMMQWVDTTGSGRVTDAGRRGDDGFASSANALMYDAGKILKTGGTSQYTGAAASAASYDIDVSRGSASVTKLTPMIYPRAYHNSVVLPDGKVFIVGGQTFAQNFQDSDSVMATEIWNPRTKQFSLGPVAGAPRNYHSVALLLPDGRVLSGGGGLCGGCSTNHPDFQLYEPGYLFDATGARASRPVIQSAPATLALGKAADVTTDREVASFALVRMGATTHTVNSDQRRIPVAFTRTGTNAYRLAVTSNSGYLLPGQWMLFALDSAGVPSVSKIVNVAPTTVATLVAPDPVALQLNASATIVPTVIPLGDGVRYSGLGLPAGLTVDQITGQISGAPTESGSFLASLVATRGDDVVSTDVSIIVDVRQTAGDGLLGEYFSGAALRGSALLQRREALDLSVTEAGPGSGVPGVFSARWRGSLRPSRGGVTRFRVESDDGVRVWIGGKLIVDDWTAHATKAAEGQVELAQGVDHPVFVEYFNSGGPGVLRLSWLRPGDADFSVVPVSELFSARTVSTANLALGRPATLSSVYPGSAAGRAVDGDTSGSSEALIAHSALQDRPWWQVDLGSATQLDYVRIWKRTDCCAERAQNLTVFVSSTDMSGRSFADLSADPLVAERDFGASVITDFIDVPVSAAGRYVRVQATAATYLNLAEVQVFGATSGAPSVAAPAAQSTKVAAAVSLQVSASDPDNDPLAFSATGLPAGLSINASSGVISGAPTTPGSYAPKVTVADPLGLTASASFAWTVVGGQPKVVQLDAAPVQAGATKSYAPVISDGDGATFGWSFGDGTADSPFAASASVGHVFATPGVYSVVLSLRAADGTTTTYSFDQAVFGAGAGAPGGASSGGSAHQPVGTGLGRLWVVNRDNDSVSAIDLDGRKLTDEIAVGKKPWALVYTTRNQVWVANRDSATISVVDASTLKVVRTIALPAGSRPSGLALVGPWSDVAVTLEASGQIMLLGPLGENYGVGDAGPGPRGLTVNAARDKAYISRFVTPPLVGESTATPSTMAAKTKVASKFASSVAALPAGAEIRVINLSGTFERTILLGASNATDTEVSGRGIPNYIGAMAISPDGKTGWVPSKQDNVFRGTLRDGQNLNFQNTVRAIVSRVDLITGVEDLSSRIDVDNAGVVSALAIHPNGAYMFAALETTRAVAVLDPVGKRELVRIPVGQAPNALSLLPGGRWLAVHNLMDRSVSLIDLQPLLATGSRTLSVAATIRTIGTEKLTATVLKGKQLFYDAADTRLARDGYISCASCHDDGEGDGRVWDLTGFGEGLRNTISLQGHGGRAQGFLHWTGNFDEIQDFEKQIRDLAGGTGLMTNSAYTTGTRSQPLGDKKAGLSADLDALAAYVSSLTTTPRSPWATASGGFTSAGLAGQSAFSRLNCASCHGGTQYTISNTATSQRNVGTIKPASGKRLGETLTRLDVPTLRGVWATAPYLHDGSAATLEAAIKAHTTLGVSDADAASLAAFLRELGPQ